MKVSESGTPAGGCVCVPWLGVCATSGGSCSSARAITSGRLCCVARPTLDAPPTAIAGGKRSKGKGKADTGSARHQSHLAQQVTMLTHALQRSREEMEELKAEKWVPSPLGLSQGTLRACGSTALTHVFVVLVPSSCGGCPLPYLCRTPAPARVPVLWLRVCVWARRAEADELREQLSVYKAEVRRLRDQLERRGAGGRSRASARSVVSFRSRVSATRPSTAGPRRRASASPPRGRAVARPHSAAPYRPPRPGAAPTSPSAIGTVPPAPPGSSHTVGGGTGAATRVPPYDPYSFTAAAAIARGRGQAVTWDGAGPEVDGGSYSDPEADALRVQLQHHASTQGQLTGPELAQRVSNLAASLSTTQPESPPRHMHTHAHTHGGGRGGRTPEQQRATVALAVAQARQAAVSHQLAAVQAQLGRPVPPQPRERRRGRRRHSPIEAAGAGAYGPYGAPEHRSVSPRDGRFGAATAVVPMQATRQRSRYAARSVWAALSMCCAAMWS